MRTSVLVPKGVHYDLDDAGHPSPRWPWVFGSILLAAVFAGLVLTFRARFAGPPTGKQTPAQAARLARANLPPLTRATPAEPADRAARLPAGADAELRRLVEGAEVAIRAGDLSSARRRYLEILERNDPGECRAFAERRLGEIGMALVLTPRPMAEKAEHVVRQGESVDRIARQYGVTRELLMTSNDLRNPERIQPGQRLLVLNKPRLAIEVRRSVRELRLFLNGQLLKRYAVGTGQRSETPAGTYVIRNRQERPDWWRPDGRKIPYGHSENILGTRWMSLQATGTTAVAKGYGIHGTWSDGEIGRSATAGCIRMRNPDVEELCLIVAEGTPVRITE